MRTTMREVIQHFKSSVTQVAEAPPPATKPGRDGRMSEATKFALFWRVLVYDRKGIVSTAVLHGVLDSCDDECGSETCPVLLSRAAEPMGRYVVPSLNRHVCKVQYACSRPWRWSRNHSANEPAGVGSARRWARSRFLRTRQPFLGRSPGGFW